MASNSPAETDSVIDGRMAPIDSQNSRHRSSDGGHQKAFRRLEAERIVRITSIVYVVGARPNFVKMAPVIHQAQRRLPAARHLIVHTGQHYDTEMSQLFLEDLELARPDYFLDVGSGAHGAQTGRALERIEAVLLKEKPGLVVVCGDVNSTLAGALAAVKLEIPVAHIEAGLRSFDRTMPEEINRVLVDQVARWCFIHSREAEENLCREGVESDRIFFVGNTMIDSLVKMRPRFMASDVHRRLGLPRGEYILVTLHRPRLVDGPLFDRMLASLRRLSRTIPVVFPVHPRARRRLGNVSTDSLHLIEPIGYIDFLALEAYARAVITDSGGVQEETTYLGVPCFTMRDGTERPITISQGTNRLMGLRPDAVEAIPALLEKGLAGAVAPLPGWDGNAADRAVEVLLGTTGKQSFPIPGPAEAHANLGAHPTGAE
jgi:UDP-N-acetylglucosamine 2-epimerase (non-hydrolysing)